jgi:hypothetical protein
MLKKYKYLQILTSATFIFSAINQKQASTLIFINKVPSVSYCSTAMLFALFNFLCPV